MSISKTDNLDDELLEEIVSLKRLFILYLVKSGVTQEEIAAALNVNQSTVSKMFPDGFKKIKKTPKK
jgi:DNA-binding NarL/FixJ family response regulator